MKKSLLFSAAALLLAGSISVSAAEVWNIETVWAYNNVNGTCNPIPGLDGGWGGLQNNPANVSATCSRFATGLNGKILTTDHIKNAIIAVGGDNSIETYVTLPARTATKWNGSAVTTDDAGNVIFDYCFIDAEKSLTQWGVVDKNKQITNIDLSTPLMDLGVTGRVDCMGHIVGDVNSAEGGIGYVTMQNSGQVLMFHFKGDGTKVTSLTAKKCTTVIEGLKADEGNSELNYAVPAYFTVSEILAAKYPQNSFYAPYGRVDWEANQAIHKDAGAKPISEGYIAAFTADGSFAPMTGIGNRCRGALASFQHNGQTYLIRNYVSPEYFEKHPALTPSLCTLNYGIFDLSGNCVASWQESDAANGQGMTSIAVDKAGDNAYNIYTYYVNGGDGKETATKAGVYAALTKLTISEATTNGSGTKADPYIIASKEDLCNAYKLMTAGATVYFKQTADIDMAGVDNYTAIAGFQGGWSYDGGETYKYDNVVYYDGGNHIIKNFAPKSRAAVDNNGYYCQSIFGVLSGEVKNLGIIDANIADAEQGVGVLASYGGHSNAIGVKVDNVFVTAKMTGSGYTGGFFGTTGNTVEVTNSYAVVDIDVAGYAGGLVGRLRNDMTVSEGYVAATLKSGKGAAGIVASSDKTPAIAGTRFFAIGEGNAAEGATATGVSVVAALDETSLGRIQKLAAFNEKKMIGEYPTLNWYNPSVVVGPGSGTEADPYIIASAEDLCNAYKLMTAGATVYFKQTADIDMAGVDNYTAIAGFQGGWSYDGGETYKYDNVVYYDGGNHIIKNFAPKSRAAVDNNGYYCQSIFGVLSGEVKNLGIIDANIADAEQGVGVLASYGGHSNAIGVKVDNVFVTAKMTGSGYTGGFFGTTGNTVEVTNSYAVVDIDVAGYAGGLVGRLRNDMTVSEGYVAATLKSGKGAAGIVASSDKAPAIAGTRFFAIGEGNAAEGATATGVSVVAALDETSLSRIQKLAAFNEKKMFENYPTLNWMTDEQISAGVDDVVVDGAENENAPVEYYNLQGMRVENPSNGIYIKRQGNKVSKIYVR
ncbi:MAG: hypothetical protein NC082_08795 [Clostridiales bacterium]|nr:hypothetical protein [Clostridiales bacterium]